MSFSTSCISSILFSADLVSLFLQDGELQTKHRKYRPNLSLHKYFIKQNARAYLTFKILLERMRYHLYDACSGWQTFPLSRKLYLTEQTVCRLLHAILVPFVKKSETHKFRPVYSPLVQSSLSDFQVTQFTTFKLFKLRKPAKVLNRCDYFLNRFLLFPLS